jgi:tRNA nucleotidyltransferase (CCA-adding enzyme)
VTKHEVAAADAKLAAALPAGSLFAVGGRVRDEVRAKIEEAEYPIKDLDYVAVGVPLDDLILRLRTLGTADLVGAAFAVVKCTFDGVTVDVALPRRERSTGAGHRDFEIRTGPDVPLVDDLARRDFRMNMIARAIPAGVLVDPYGGEADILGRRIDLLRVEAFEEDPLRMLRACQFAARFRYAIAPGTMDAMRAAAPRVASVSAERVRDELIKLLSAELPSVGFEAMREGGLTAVILPELLEGYGVDQNEWHAFDVYRHSLETVDAAPRWDLTVRLAALLHDVAKPRTKQGPHFYRHEVVGEVMAREVLQRLRFSTEEVERVGTLVRRHMYVADPAAKDAAIRRFVRTVGSTNLPRLFQLRAADIAGSGLPKRGDANDRFQERVYAELQHKPPLSVRDLAVGGTEVVEALRRAGRLQARGDDRMIGVFLRGLLERVTDDPSLNERETLLRLLDKLLKEQPAPRSLAPRETLP